MSNIKVAVRVRPLTKRELELGSRDIVEISGDTINVTNTKVDSQPEYGDSRERVKTFTFDYCYDSSGPPNMPGYASQQLVFQDLGTEVLEAAFDGYNACMFAYGQTSTGKTYTMMGEGEEYGLIPRICEALFSRVDDFIDDNFTFKVDISYLEIYNERVRDLLQAPPVKQSEKYTLKVREHPKDGPYVQDLSRHLIKDNQQIQSLIEKANENRTTSSTHMHQHSSRSHAIVTVTFTQARLEDDLPSEIVSKVHLVDLAGSERASTTQNLNYKDRLKEGANINKSLVTLGNVIKCLAERSMMSMSADNAESWSQGSSDSVMTSSLVTPRRSRSLYVPYRDSVLTWLLKDSLGGNSKTIMISTISPASAYYNETVSTLRYSQRAKSIINKPKINEDSNVTLIKELRREIEHLRVMLISAQTRKPVPEPCLGVSDLKDNAVSLQESSVFLCEKLEENVAAAKQLTRHWIEKWQETQDILTESDLSIRRPLGKRSSSMGVIVDSQQPHLRGMDDDILNTGIVLYYLKEGKTLIGSDLADREQDIVLTGQDIQPEHCFIQFVDGTVILYPRHNAPCAINGIEVTQPTKLTQGDTVRIGDSLQFRFNNPAEAAKLREFIKNKNSSDSLVMERDVQTDPESGSAIDAIPDVPLINKSLPVEQDQSEKIRIKDARVQLQRVKDKLEKAVNTYNKAVQQMQQIQMLQKGKQEDLMQILNDLVANCNQMHMHVTKELSKMKTKQDKGTDTQAKSTSIDEKGSPGKDSESPKCREEALKAAIDVNPQLQELQKAWRASEAEVTEYEQKMRLLKEEHNKAMMLKSQEVSSQLERVNILKKQREKLEQLIEEVGHLKRVSKDKLTLMHGANTDESVHYDVHLASLLQDSVNKRDCLRQTNETSLPKGQKLTEEELMSKPVGHHNGSSCSKAPQSKSVTSNLKCKKSESSQLNKDKSTARAINKPQNQTQAVSSPSRNGKVLPENIQLNESEKNIAEDHLSDYSDDSLDKTIDEVNPVTQTTKTADSTSHAGPQVSHPNSVQKCDKDFADVRSGQTQPMQYVKEESTQVIFKVGTKVLAEPSSMNKSESVSPKLTSDARNSKVSPGGGRVGGKNSVNGSGSNTQATLGGQCCSDQPSNQNSTECLHTLAHSTAQGSVECHHSPAQSSNLISQIPKKILQLGDIRKVCTSKLPTKQDAIEMDNLKPGSINKVTIKPDIKVDSLKPVSGQYCGQSVEETCPVVEMEMASSPDKPEARSPSGRNAQETLFQLDDIHGQNISLGLKDSPELPSHHLINPVAEGSCPNPANFAQNSISSELKGAKQPSNVKSGCCQNVVDNQDCLENVPKSDSEETVEIKLGNKTVFCKISDKKSVRPEGKAQNQPEEVFENGCMSNRLSEFVLSEMKKRQSSKVDSVKSQSPLPNTGNVDLSRSGKSQQSQTKSSNIPHIISSERTGNVKKDFDKNLTGSKESMVSGKSEQTDFDLIATKKAEPLHGRDCSEMRLRTKNENLPSKVALNSRLVNAPSDQSLVTPEESCLASNSCHLEGNLGENQVGSCLPVRIAPENKNVEAKCKPVPNTKCQKKPIGQSLSSSSSSSSSSPSMTHPLQESNDSSLVRNSKPIISTHSHEERSSYLDQDPGSNVSLPNKTTKLSHCSARTELVTEFSDDHAGKACPLTYIVKVSEEETNVFYNVESTDYKISKIRKTLPATKGLDQIDSLITTESFCADTAGLAKEKSSGAAFNHSSSNSNIPRSETNSKSSSKLAKDSLLHSLDVGKTELEDNPSYSIDRKESLISDSNSCIKASHDHSKETCLLKSKGTLASDSRSMLHDGCQQCLQTGTDLQETVVLNGKVKDSTNTIDDSHQKTPTDHSHLTCNSSVVGSPSSRSSNGEWVTCNLGLYGLRRETKLKNMTKCMSDSAISSDLTDVDSGTLSPQPSNIPSWLCSHHPHHHYNHHNHRNFNRLVHLDLPEMNKFTSCANNNPMTPSKPLDLFPWCKSSSSFVGSLLKVRPYSIGRSISVDGLNVWLSKVPISDLQPTCKNHSNDEMINKYPESGRLNPSKTLANTPNQSAESCNPHQDSAAEFETVDPTLTEMKQDSYSSSASSSPTSASLYMGQYQTGGSMVNSQEEFEKLERDLPSDISSLHSGFSGRHGNDNWHHSDVINEPDLIGINDDNDGYLYFKSDDDVRVGNFQRKFLSRPTKMAGQKSSRIKFVDAKEQNLQRRYKYHAPNSGWSSTDDSADTTFRYMKAPVVKSKNIKGVGHNSSFINDDDDDDESVFEDDISQYHHSGKRNRFPVLPHSKSASTTDLPADYPTSPSSYRSVSPSLSSEIAIEDERSMKYKPKLISVGIQTSQNECATQTENQPSLASDFTIPSHDQILKDSQASNRMPFPIHIPLLIPESGTLHSLPALMLETTNLLKNLTKHLTVDPSLPSPASETSSTSFNNNLKCNTSTQTECKPNVPSAPDNGYPQSYISDKENHSREYFPNMTQAQQNIVNQEQRAYTNGNYSQPSELHINRNANPNSYSSLHQQKKRLYLPLKQDTSTLGSNSSTLDAFKGDMCDSFTYHPQGHPNYREDCQAPAQHYPSYRYQSNSPSEPNASRQHHRSPNDLNPNLVGSAQHFHSTPYKNDVDFSRQFKFNQSSPLPNGNFDRFYHSMKYTTPSANKRPWQDIINYSEYNLDSTVHDIHVNPNWPHSNFRNSSPGAHVPCQDFSGHSYGNNYMNHDVASQQGAGPRHRFRSMTIASNDMSRVRLPLNRHNTLPRSSLSHSPNQPFFQENTAWEPQPPPFQQYATLPRGYKFGSSNLLDYNNDPRHAFDYPDNQNIEDYYNEELSLSLRRSGVTDEYLELLTKSVKSSPTEQPSSSNSVSDRPKYRTLSNLTSPSDRPQPNRFNKSLSLPTYKSSQSKSPNTQFTCEGLETKSFSDVANEVGARVEYYGTEKSNDGSSMVDCNQNNDIDTVMKLNQQYSKMISKEKSSAKSQPKHLSQRQKENQSQKQALEKKFKKWEEEQLDIMDMVNLKYLPVSFTVKYLEKKVNHCIAQTDMLLDTLDEDEGTTPTETDDPNSSIAEDQTNEDSSSIVSGFSSSMDQPHLLCHQDEETVSSDRQNESLNNSSELSPNTWLQLQSSIPNLLTDDYATSNESENHTQVDSCDDVIHTDSENDIDTRTYTRYSQSSLTNLSLSGSDQTLPESQYHSVDESHLQGVVTMSAGVFKGHQANMNELSMIHNGLSETEEGNRNRFCQTEGNRRLPRYFNKQVNDCNKQSNSCSSLNNTDALSDTSLRLHHEESLRRNRTALTPNYRGMTPSPLIYRQRSSSTDH
ncbi:uncharacterized protein LOC106874278 isoform X1 [Octopus bimaculoides]|nr:uncharacterized protein LOC106874278 isoform X1 [Octopus bimaculoides]|eukprot:XP_014777436.1 PREDICTED: uncharacterized protein LOC106874278 isoform X1 [Octopus bimaculoides]